MKKLYIICNSHIDPIWQWSWEEGVGAAISTFQSIVNLADEYDFIFCHNEAYLYEYVEKYDEVLFSRIKKLVEQGKWKIMGGWYVQPDCNLPIGESLFRQIEVGNKYFKEKFGVTCTTAINFDPFGHSKGLVQILTKSGYDSYLIKRPEENVFHLENDLFWWCGYDGSKVKVFRLERYGTLMGHAVEHIEYLQEYFKNLDEFPVMIGLGNHGGGLSRKDLKEIKEYKKDGVMIKYSYPEEFFKDKNPSVTVDKPLNHVFPGCYSSISTVKRKHIELENALYVTEGLCSLAELTNNFEYQTDFIDQSVKDLLINEFHDVLPGTIIKSAEKDVLRQLDHGIENLNKVFVDAFFNLVQTDKAAGEGEYPIFVYNPTPYERKTVIEVEFTLCPSNDGAFDDSLIRVFTEDGCEVLAQSLKEESNLNWDCRQRIAFECVLKPFCINRFYAIAKRIDRVNIKYKNLSVDGYISSVVDKASGKLNSLVVEGVEYLSNSGVSLTMYDDNPDPWGMADYQQEKIGDNKRYFKLQDKPCGVFDGMSPVQTVEGGNVLTAVESFYSLDNSSARVKYIMYQNMPYVDIEVDLYFCDAYKAVRLEIPTTFIGKYIGQTVFGVQEMNADERECVSHRFVAIENNDGKCFAVLNNCVYGSKIEDGKICLTLSRSVGYCMHPLGQRTLIPEGRYSNIADMGEHKYTFRLVVCNKDELWKLSDEFNKKPYSLNHFPRGKDKKEKLPFFEIFNSAVVLSSLRKRDGEFICRLFNSTDEKVRTKIRLNNINKTIDFNKFEIKTFKINQDDLIEIKC